MELPVYKLQVDDTDESGVGFVALVDEPAIKVDWLAFSKQAPLKFEVESESQRIISGPLMIPGSPMFRKGNQVVPQDHYVLFDAPTIKQCCLKFMREQNTTKVNLMHQEAARPDGVFMFESFLIDPSRGIHPPEKFKDLPIGTWFGSYKVDNSEVWDEFIATGIFKGFSVEGFFRYPESPVTSEEALLRQIEDVINGK